RDGGGILSRVNDRAFGRNPGGNDFPAGVAGLEQAGRKKVCAGDWSRSFAPPADGKDGTEFGRKVENTHGGACPWAERLRSSFRRVKWQKTDSGDHPTPGRDGAADRGDDG